MSSRSFFTFRSNVPRPARAGHPESYRRLATQFVSLVALAGALAFVSGCATIPQTPAVVLTGDPLTDGNAQLAVAPPKDRALWEYRVAATALRRDLADEAKAKLDDALALAAANYGNANSEPAKSRGLFRNESDKAF